MVLGKVRDSAQLDEEAEKARLARKAEMEAERAAFSAKRAAERGEQDKAADEKKKEEQRLAEEKRKEEERIADEKRKEEERIAEEKRKEEQRVAEEKRKEEERVAEEKKKEEERAAEEARQKEAARVAEERRLAEKKRREEEAEADRLRREAEEKKKMEEAMRDMEALLELEDGPILFDTFGEMGLKCISHREHRVVNAEADGSVTIIIGCCNLEKARMLLKLEREDKSVVGEHAVMCTMSHNASIGPHFVAQALCPAAGEYSLKFFCNNEAGKTGYAHVATYTIAANNGAPSTLRYPKLHPAVAMSLIEPICDAVQSGEEVKYKVVLGPGVTAAQVANADGKRHPLAESKEGDQRVASGVVKVVSGDQNEGMVNIICQKDGGEEWLVFTKFAILQ